MLILYNYCKNCACETSHSIQTHRQCLTTFLLPLVRKSDKHSCFSLSLSLSSSLALQFLCVFHSNKKISLSLFRSSPHARQSLVIQFTTAAVAAVHTRLPCPFTISPLLSPSNSLSLSLSLPQVRSASSVSAHAVGSDGRLYLFVTR